MPKKYLLLLLIICLTIAASVFLHTNNKKNQLTPKVLIIYKEGTDNYLDIYQNYKQSYILNTNVVSISDNEVVNKDISDYSIVYPDASLISSPYIDKIKSIFVTYVEHGGCLFLENEWHKLFPQSFTGVSSYVSHKNNTYNFSYPEVGYNLKQLQLVVKIFLDNFVEYRKDDINSIPFNKGNLGTAQSIANIDNYSLLSLNKYSNGYVFMSGSLLPSTSLITGPDLKAKIESQKYFDYTLSTANYFIRNEFLAFSLKEKYGYVFKKVFGPYGRPAMSWQNHYEALSSIKDKEMIKWVDLLKEYNQVPSFSLIRSTFDWGQWKSDITVHLNVGSAESPKFIGEYDDSYYSSGKRLSGGSDYLTFGDYPEYKSLFQSITLPHRAYPSVVDYDNDGDKDLIVGAPDGKLYLVKNIGTPKEPLFNDKEELKLITGQPALVESFASPFVYDINKDGLFDIVVGNGNGEIDVFINKGSIGLPTFVKADKLTISGKLIKTNGVSAPAIGDIDNDNIDDLIIGSSSGSVVMYKGTKDGFIYVGEIINASKNDTQKFSAPTVYDWNNDGYRDILLGDNSGTIKLFINNHNDFTFNKIIEGGTHNPQGTKYLIGGHNSVPLVTDWNDDGKQDLLVGQLEFGIPYDIDGKFFKYKNELKENVEYALSHGIPIYPHVSTHKYKTTEQEASELSLHKKAFEAYNLQWQNTGTDQHTWRTNTFDSQQTLKNEMNAGIWWNFGFNPPNEPDLPRDGKEFMWSTPFLLSNKENINNFVIFTPSPNLFKYPNVYNSFLTLDMPVTYFEHIEYRFSKPNALNELKQMADFLNIIRYKGEYNFMTQEQMAKSFINTFYSKANVKMNDNQITLTPDTGFVPSLADEYKNTLGLKLEKGEKYKDTPISTTSPIYYGKDNCLYFGLSYETKLFLNKNINNNFHVVRSNIPIKISSLLGTRKIKLLSSGMQQIKLFSADDINIEGNNIKVDKEGQYYTVTHYGQPIAIKIINTK